MLNNLRIYVMIFFAWFGMTMVQAAYSNWYDQPQNWRRQQGVGRSQKRNLTQGYSSYQGAPSSYRNYQESYPVQGYSASQTYPQNYRGYSAYSPVPSRQRTLGQTYNRLQKQIRRQRPSYRKRREMLEYLQLEGFDANQDQLTRAFQELIQSIPSSVSFPIKIDRKKGVTGPNVYYYSAVGQNQSRIFGTRESNRSRTVGGGGEINRQIFGSLLQMLDKEGWISKIVITFDGQKYIVKKFGMGHALYRGGMNVGRVFTR